MLASLLAFWNCTKPTQIIETDVFGVVIIRSTSNIMSNLPRQCK